MVVTKSTVPVGTSRRLAEQIRNVRPDLKFDMVSNPEFLREGSAVRDFLEPNRVVIGAESLRARSTMEELYTPLQTRQRPILFTSLEAAELTKYVANAYLATRITFINEVANLCEVLGVDVREIAKGIGLDHRIGPSFLHPGPGFGGSCFPKDTRALATTARRGGVRLELVEAVISLNERRKRLMSSRIVEACGGSVSGLTIAVLGVTFKAGTDDMRDAPSLEIVPALTRAGASVRAYDPHGMGTGRAALDGIDWCTGAYEAASGADAAVILTEWDEFRTLDPARLLEVMREPRIIDLRNLYEPEEMRSAGFAYSSVGRPAVDGRPLASLKTGSAEAAGLTSLAAT